MKVLKYMIKWEIGSNFEDKERRKQEYSRRKKEVELEFERHEKEMGEMIKRGKWIDRLVYFIFVSGFVFFIIILLILSRIFVSDDFVRWIGL